MNNIAASIVLYNPDLIRLKENIDAIYNKIDKLVLIDNGSNNIKLVEDKYYNYNKITIIKNNNNLGIAKALNQAIEFLESKGYEWVLTLDQDSVTPENIIFEYSKYINDKDIGIISPVIVDRNIKNQVFNNENKSTIELIDKCITSASLTNVEVWRKIGGFDEIMFIDLVDFEYCERIIFNGYKIIRVNTVELLHEIGNITQHKFLTKEVNIMNHSAFRKYYMTRNLIYVAYKHKTKSSVSSAYFKIIKLFLATILYENNKCNKISRMVKGVIDGNKLVH